MRFHCEGMRACEAANMVDAARVFAERLARKKYGRRGVVGALRPESQRCDGRMGYFIAFIGKGCDNRKDYCAIEGGEARLTIRKEEKGVQG